MVAVLAASEEDEDTVTIAFKTGDIVTFDWNGLTATKAGTFPDGLSAVRVSPDHQLVCAVTSPISPKPEVILMTTELDVLAQFPLGDADGDASTAVR